MTATSPTIYPPPQPPTTNDGYALRAPSHSLWVVVSSDGRVLARTRISKHYRVWTATRDGRFLATYWDDEKLQFFAVKLAVAISGRS